MESCTPANAQARMPEKIPAKTPTKTPTKMQSSAPEKTPEKTSEKTPAKTPAKMQSNAPEKTNIVLLGFMGSGKTVIGRQAAALLNFDFADTDEEIREVTGLELPRLYRKHGEIRCRSEERLLISKLSRADHTVIACGGSLPPDPENLRLLAEKGWFVLLTAQPEIIRARIARKRDRLLAKGKVTPEFISRQAQDWESSYADYADCRIDSGRLGVEEAAEAIVKAWQQRSSAIRS